MKLKKNSKTIIIITLGIFIKISTIFIFNINLIPGNNYPCLDLNQESNFHGRNIQTSKISGKIHIDDNDPTSNWAIAKGLGICTGNGTFSEPYVIKDLVIDGEGSGICILIENSDIYFKIENCSLYNSRNWNFAGIELFNSTKGNLISNNCSNNYRGIYLDHSNNNTITGNNAIYSNNTGIILRSSDYNDITGNTASYNDFTGIQLTKSNNNTISGNIANHNEIGIYSSSNNNIIGNTASYNIEYGIYLGEGCNGLISGNIMNECGLQLDYISGISTSYIIDTTNLVNGKPLYFYFNELNLGPSNFTNAGQVILVSCSDSLISNLNTSNTSTGISLYYCNNNNITGNTANNHVFFNSGIFLFHSDNNTVSGNTVNNNNWAGIRTYSSNYNTFSGNNANNNSCGIHLWKSNHNTVSGNTANENNCGISISESYNITVSGNMMNECGLRLDDHLAVLTSLKIDATNLVNGKPLYFYVNKINLGPNNFTNAGQVILVGCNDSLISNLNTSNGSEGIGLYYCNNNNILENTVSYNIFVGIYLWFSDYNTISGNSVNSNGRGINLYNSDNNIVSENSANTNYWGIELLNCINTIISVNTLNYNIVVGISLRDGYNTTISENIAFNNTRGIYLLYSKNNIISRNIICNTTENGMYLRSSDYNTITGNIVNNNFYGILLSFSDHNIIARNTLLENVECILEDQCEGNQFCDNGSCTYGDCPDDEVEAIPGYNLIFLLGVISLILLIIKKNLSDSEKGSIPTVN